MPELPPPSSRRPAAERRRFRPGRLIPPLVFIGIALLILSDAVPGVREAFDRIVHPAAHAAQLACRRAALAAAERPDFARVVRRGTVHRTQHGFYVEGILVGEMGPSGAELRYRYSCYVDAAGRIAGTERRASTAAAGEDRQPAAGTGG